MPLFSKFKRPWQKTKDSSSTFSGDSSEFTPSLTNSSSPATSFLPVPPHFESPTCKVYLKYDVATPPPRPAGENWTRFVCIGDTCGETFPVPSGDVLLHAGNLTASGKFHEFKQTAEWLYSLDHTVKILVAGSNDTALHRDFMSKHRDWSAQCRSEEDYDAIIDLLKGSRAREAGMVYLEDSSFTFKVRENSRTWRIFGFPWVVKWGNAHAFGYLPFPVAEAYVSKIPPIDILLSHGPPNGILDETTRDGLSGLHVGCLTLLDHMKRIRPYLHIFGHVFEGHGAEVRMHDTDGIVETLEVNATMLPNTALQDPCSSSADISPASWPPIILDIYDVEE